jgi:hypothetical protein
MGGERTFKMGRLAVTEKEWFLESEKRRRRRRRGGGGGGGAGGGGGGGLDSRSVESIRMRDLWEDLGTGLASKCEGKYRNKMKIFIWGPASLASDPYTYKWIEEKRV